MVASKYYFPMKAAIIPQQMADSMLGQGKYKVSREHPLASVKKKKV
jgi:hypothetical protein